jgi:predicted cation transporter
VIDPGDWLPLIGVVMLAGTTVISIAGAYALGRSRRREVPKPQFENDLTDRVDRVERLMETMAVEIERLGEGQRFMIKVMSEKPASLPGADAPGPRSPGRVITPH